MEILLTWTGQPMHQTDMRQVILPFLFSMACVVAQSRPMYCRYNGFCQKTIFRL